MEYWDVGERKHQIWEVTQDPNKDFQCRECHTYPDSIVHAIDYERSKLREEITHLEECLQSAYRKIDQLRECYGLKKTYLKNWETVKGRILQGQADQSQKEVGKLSQK